MNGSEMMSDIEFLISLYGVILGLSLAEVLAGLGRLVEARERVVAGRLLFAMLGLFLLVDISLFWSWLWSVRHQIAVNAGTILLGVLIASLYYLAAYLAFPRRIALRENLELYFTNTKRWIVGPVLAANLVTLPAILLATKGEGWSPADYGFEAVYFVLMLGALLVRTPRYAPWFMTAAVLFSLTYVVIVEWLRLL